MAKIYDNTKLTKFLWDVMSITGRGFRKPSFKSTGRGNDRRPDRFGKTKAFRQYYNRYS